MNETAIAKTIQVNNYPRAGFSSLRISDILAWILLFWRAEVRVAGYLAAPLPSTH